MNLNSGDEMPPFKLLLHENYCKKNIKLCEICGEKVVIDDLEDHKKTLHTKVDCKICGARFEPDLMLKHQELCNDKKYHCKYCELELDKGELQEHEYICGSKTELCELCSNFVAIKGT